MSSIIDIIQRYSNVNTEEGTDKITSHSYGDLYQQICAPWKEKDDLTVLEIGISGGAFLRVMSEYFAPTATIYGIDIDIRPAKFANNIPNVQLFQLDGTNPSTPIQLNKQYDFIVEDGSHYPEDQKKTLDVFAPYLKQGGVFVMEDIHEVHAGMLQQDLSKIAENHGLVMEWHDLRNKKKRFDDIVAVFRRPIS